MELGKSGGGLCYGYKVRRATHDGTATTGNREIVPAEAEVILRIFRDYAAGVSPKSLAKRLNAERCPGPEDLPGIRAPFTAIRRAAPESSTTSYTSAGSCGTVCAM